MHDMFLCFCGMAEQVEQLPCTQTFSYRNRGPNRHGERHSEICTLDTSQTVTPSVRCGCSQLCTYHRQYVLNLLLNSSPYQYVYVASVGPVAHPSKYFAIDEGLTIFRTYFVCILIIYRHTQFNKTRHNKQLTL